MLRCLAVLTALTVIISFASCADRSAAIHPKPLDDVSFSCVIFNGPSSELKFDGHISHRKPLQNGFRKTMVLAANGLKRHLQRQLSARWY